MSKLSLVKNIISITTGLSTGYCVNQVITNNVQPETGAEVAKAMIGTAAISSLVVAHTREHVSTMVDEMVDFYNELKTKKETPAES